MPKTLKKNSKDSLANKNLQKQLLQIEEANSNQVQSLQSIGEIGQLFEQQYQEPVFISQHSQDLQIKQPYLYKQLHIKHNIYYTKLEKIAQYNMTRTIKNCIQKNETSAQCQQKEFLPSYSASKQGNRFLKIGIGIVLSYIVLMLFCWLFRGKKKKQYKKNGKMNTFKKTKTKSSTKLSKKRFETDDLSVDSDADSDDNAIEIDE